MWLLKKNPDGDGLKSKNTKFYHQEKSWRWLDLLSIVFFSLLLHTPLRSPWNILWFQTYKFLNADLNSGHWLVSLFALNLTTIPSTSWYDSQVRNIWCERDMTCFVDMLVWHISVLCRNINWYHFILVTGLNVSKCNCAHRDLGLLSLLHIRFYTVTVFYEAIRSFKQNLLN